MSKREGVKTSLGESAIGGEAELSHEERAKAEKEGLHFGRDESGGGERTDAHGESETERSEDEEETF